jgi:hypothetical protein
MSNKEVYPSRVDGGGGGEFKTTKIRTRKQRREDEILEHEKFRDFSLSSLETSEQIIHLQPTRACPFLNNQANSLMRLPIAVPL